MKYLSNNKIAKKVQKFGPHSVAPKIPEELKKQKSNRKGWVLFCKRFQSASFMCEKKSVTAYWGTYIGLEW